MPWETALGFTGVELGDWSPQSPQPSTCPRFPVVIVHTSQQLGSIKASGEGSKRKLLSRLLPGGYR